MWKYSSLTFEWKHIDERILYFANPSNARLKIELIKIIFPFLFIIIIFFAFCYYSKISINIFFIFSLIIFLFFSFTVFYKIYRTKNNYIYITTKRILFHWIDWFFKDYVKKISYENIRNINYFTWSFFWKIFKYWNLEIQSSHWWDWDIKFYHIKNWKMIAHYIDKLISLSPEERKNFKEFDPDYFKYTK